MKSSFLSSLLFSIRSLPFFLDSSFFLLLPSPLLLFFSLLTRLQVFLPPWRKRGVSITNRD